MFDRVDSHVLRVAAVLALAVLAGVLFARPPAPSAPPTSISPISNVAKSSTDLILVHVSGEVASAGLVEVAPTARVADVIAAAGGVSHEADLLRVNLAEPVVDGQHVVVPSVRRQQAQDAVADPSDGRVRINDADEASLETLPGVGPVLAGKIVAHRSEYGPFRSVEDLLDVPGIGEQKLASLRDLVIVP